MTIKHNDIVKIEKLSQRDVYPIYGRPFNLKEGDICQVLIVDSSDETFPYFLRKDGEDFWFSSETELSIVENCKRDMQQKLIDDLKYLTEQITNLLNELEH